MLLTSFPPALHCVVRPNNLNMLTDEVVKNALKAVKYPGYNRDIVSFGLVKQIATKDGTVSVSMQLTTHNPEVANQIKAESERVLQALPGVSQVHVEVNQHGAPQAAAPQSPWAHRRSMPLSERSCGAGVPRLISILELRPWSANTWNSFWTLRPEIGQRTGGEISMARRPGPDGEPISLRCFSTFTA